MNPTIPRALGLLLVLTAGSTAASAPPAPDEIPALIAAAGTTADHPDADAVVVSDHTDVEVEASGLSHIVHNRLVKVLNPAGARHHSFQRFDFDPASQVIEVRHVRVWRAGTTTEEVDLTGLVDVIAPAHMIYWSARMKAITVPNLRAGDAVEIETYRKGFMIAYLGQDDERYVPPMRGHFYDVVLFQEGLPLHQKSYELRTPRDKPIQFAVYNGAVASESTFDAEHTTYRFWSAQPQPAAPREWSSPGISDYVPKVVLATVADWEAKSRWFYEANAQQFAATPAIQAKVDELIAGLDSEAEKIAAINHWVAQNIRYCGHNMGEGEGYTLHPGDMVFTERAGVCKDIASMSITMLGAAGFEVYPAMTMAGSRVESIPADQFNHCVGAVRLPDGTYEMVDPTWVPFAMNNWSRAEGEQHFVIGTPWGEELMCMPAYPPEENRVALQVRGRIETDGSLVGTLVFDVAGYADTRLRRFVGLAPRDEVAERLLRWLENAAPGAELIAWRAGDAEDFSRPLTLELEFRLPGYAVVGARTVSWQPVAPGLALNRMGGLFRLPSAPPDEERQTPALLWAAQRISVSEEIQVPRRYRLQPHDDPPRAGDESDFAFCITETEVDGRKLRLSGTVQYQRRTVTVAEWPVFRAAVQAWRDLAALRFGGRRKEG